MYTAAPTATRAPKIVSGDQGAGSPEDGVEALVGMTAAVEAGIGVLEAGVMGVLVGSGRGVGTANVGTVVFSDTTW